LPRADSDVELDDDLEPGDEFVDDDGFDEDTELTLDLSQEEAESEVREYNVLPQGRYTGYIVDGEVKRSTGKNNPANKGKPYWRLKIKFQDGPQGVDVKNRTIFTNVMLWEGAGFTLGQLLKALDVPITKPQKVPPLSKVKGNGKLIGLVLSKQFDKWKADDEGWEKGSKDPRPMKNEVKGFFDPKKATVVGAVSARTTSDDLP
jgi:hypothetical protein